MEETGGGLSQSNSATNYIESDNVFGILLIELPLSDCITFSSLRTIKHIL